MDTVSLILMDPCIVDYSVEIPTRCSFVIEFIIPKFFEGSACFERHTTHHQELQTVFAASGLYAHMVTSRCQGWVGNGFPLSLGNSRSSHRYINQRLRIQFRAPDDEQCAARNMWAFKKRWNNKFYYKAASSWYFYLGYNIVNANFLN
jgi:hypothetical protein